MGREFEPLRGHLKDKALQTYCEALSILFAYNLHTTLRMCRRRQFFQILFDIPINLFISDLQNDLFNFQNCFSKLGNISGFGFPREQRIFDNNILKFCF